MIIKVYEACQYSYPKYHVLAMFVLHIFFSNYSYILKFLSIRLRLGLNGIQIYRFFLIPKYLSYLLNFHLIFMEKEHEIAKKLNKIYKQSCYSFSINLLIIIFGLFFIRKNAFYEYLDEPKKHIDFINNNRKLFIKTITVPLWLDDCEIIWDAGVGCESESIDQGRSYVDENINIALCFFSRYLSYHGYGGVIYLTASSCSMNINYSMFFNCVCSSWGGAICFYSTKSFLRMICANRCSCGTSSSGHFAYLCASPVNQVEYLSVSNCSHTSSGYNPIRLFTGNQRVDNTNSSMNNAIQYSGIFIDSTSSFTSSHCTFSNNKVSDSRCIYFYSDSGTLSMSYANIVHNNNPSDYGVICVEGAGTKKMIYCIFHNNQNYLFYVDSGSLEVSHSFIDHSVSSFSRSTSVSTTNNNSFANRITYQFQFFKSHYCNAQLPVPVPSPMRTATLAPTKTFEISLIRSFEETIRRTNEETLRMTIERTIDQTIRETLIKTLEQSPTNTIDHTIRETPKETIHRSYAECIFTHQMANWREISVIFSFAFLYPVIILMIS